MMNNCEKCIHYRVCKFYESISIPSFKLEGIEKCDFYEEPNKGEWKFTADGVKCSVCNCYQKDWDNYCSNCGAKNAEGWLTDDLW